MFDNYKFRCSDLPTLMSGAVPKGLTKLQKEKLEELTQKPKLTDKQMELVLELQDKGKYSPELSKTCKSKLKDIWLDATFGRKQILVNDTLAKGTEQEQDSINLYQLVNQEFCPKNETKFENDFICGTPDLVLDNKIVDIKTSRDIFTFSNIDNPSFDGYLWQLAGYCWLQNKTWGEVTFCLVSSNPIFVENALKKLSWQTELQIGSQEFENYESQTIKNLIVDDIDPKTRIKTKSWEFDQSSYDLISQQVVLWREYLKTLSL